VYVPPRYKVSEDAAWALVDAAGAGFLVVTTSVGARSVFAPVLATDDRTTLLAHVARGNPLWSDAASGDEVLALFKAADAYVSPTWYPGRHDDPRVAPTWDYDVVEVRGRVTVRDDVEFTERVVRSLTDRHEHGRVGAWRVEDAPREFVDALLRGIVGLEIEVVAITGAAKLSQTKDESDRAFVRGRLAAGSERERAVAVRMVAS
jgi:transcriptional regulator